MTVQMFTTLLLFIINVMFVRNTLASAKKGDFLKLFAMRAAIKNEDLIEMAALLDNGMDVNTGSPMVTFLMTAIDAKKPLSVKFLLEKGADPNFHLPLVRSASDIDLEIAHMLVEAGAHVEVPNDEGSTALHIAVTRENNEDIINFLIETGADVDILDKMGRSALLLASHYMCQGNVQLLLELKPDLLIDSADNRGWTALMVSTYRRSFDITRMLLYLGADPNFRNDNGDTPLHLAIRDISAPIDIPFKQRTIPTFSWEWPSSEPIRLRLVKLLLIKGANPDVVNIHGDRPIDLASDLDHEAVIRIFKEFSK